MAVIYFFAKLSKKVTVGMVAAPISDLRLLPVVTVPMGTESRSCSKVSGPLTLTVCCVTPGGPWPKSRSLSTHSHWFPR